MFERIVRCAKTDVDVCGSKQADMCIDVCLERNKQGEMRLPPETTSHREPHPTRNLNFGLESFTLWGFLPEVLRTLLERTQAVPQEAMLGPHQGLSPKQGPGRGDLPASRPCPAGRGVHSAGFPF